MKSKAYSWNQDLLGGLRVVAGSCKGRRVLKQKKIDCWLTQYYFLEFSNQTEPLRQSSQKPYRMKPMSHYLVSLLIHKTWFPMKLPGICLEENSTRDALWERISPKEQRRERKLMSIIKHTWQLVTGTQCTWQIVNDQIQGFVTYV